MNPWLEAARPKTLSAGLVPVLVGSALSFHEGQFSFLTFLACLVGAISLQIATNYINDASDFLRGADTEERIGPKRMAQAGILSPKSLYFASTFLLLLATLAGFYLTWKAGPVILVIGILSIIAAIAYTAGPYPLAYLGLGDLFVLIFFGFIAVCGTYFAHTQNLKYPAILSSLIIGFFSIAIIAVNNTRDIQTDTKVKKRTLAVRMGEKKSKKYYSLILFFPFIFLLFLCLSLKSLCLFLPFFLLPLAIKNYKKMEQAQSGADYNILLADTAKLQIFFSLLLCIGLVITPK